MAHQISKFEFLTKPRFVHNNFQRYLKNKMGGGVGIEMEHPLF